MRKGLFAAVVVAGLALSGTFALKAKAAGDYLPVGSKAPDFSAISQEDKAVHLSDYKGKWVVLYFYPKDQTTGCTIEAHNFQRDIAYNVPISERGTMKFAARTTYLIDPKGKVVKVWEVKDIPNHSEQVLAEIAAAHN